MGRVSNEAVRRKMRLNDGAQHAILPRFELVKEGKGSRGFTEENNSPHLM